MEDAKTVTRADISRLFSKQLFLPHNKAAALTEIIMDEINLSLCKHDELKVSSFGTFLVHNKSSRVGRNPKTGEKALITARRSVSFRSSHLLRDKVNRPSKIKRLA